MENLTHPADEQFLGGFFCLLSKIISPTASSTVSRATDRTQRYFLRRAFSSKAIDRQKYENECLKNNFDLKHMKITN